MLGKNKKIFLAIIFGSLCLFIIGLAVKVSAGAEHNVYGWAWSSNIGWISFNSINCDSNGNGQSDGSPVGCPVAGTPMANYGVDMNYSTGILSGYAWSSNVGWLTFNEADLAGCPVAPCRAWADPACLGANQLTWYSTLDSAAAVTSPAVGSGGTVSGATFAAGRVGNAANFDGLNDYIYFPTANNIDLSGDSSGVIDFWARPDWNSNATGRTYAFTGDYNSASGDLFGLGFCGSDAACAGSGLGTAGDLSFSTMDGGVYQSRLVISAANYSWTAGDWVHIRLEWNDTAASDRLKVFINGTEPTHTHTNDASLDISALSLLSNWYIGDMAADSLSFDGMIDEFRVFSHCETSGWARMLANGGGWSGWLRLNDTNYHVWIDSSVTPSEFNNWAWSDMVQGWTSFNCRDRGVCAASNYKVMLGTSIVGNPPDANFICDPGSCTVYQGDLLTLINQSTDSDSTNCPNPCNNDIVLSRWDIMSWGSNPDLGCSGTCNYTIQTAMMAPGTYDMELYVQDTIGLSDTMTRIGLIRILGDALADFMCSSRGQAGTWEVCDAMTITPKIGDTIYLRDIVSLTRHSIPSEGATAITNRTWSLNGTIFSQFNDDGPSAILTQQTNTLQLDIIDDAGRPDTRIYQITARLSLPDWIEIRP